MRPGLPVIFLVLANLLPLAGVFLLGWSVFPIMLVFWLENIIVGLLNIPRILFAMGPAEGQEKAFGRRLFSAVFFVIHYGLFTAVHGAFVFSLFGEDQYDDPTPQLVWQIIQAQQLYWAIGALFISHLISLVMNYFLAGEYRSAKVNAMMKQPYNRIVVLHLGIIFGGIVIDILMVPLAGLLVLLTLKIIFDVRAHLKEHNALASDAVLST